MVLTFELYWDSSGLCKCLGFFELSPERPFPYLQGSLSPGCDESRSLETLGLVLIRRGRRVVGIPEINCICCVVNISSGGLLGHAAVWTAVSAAPSHLLPWQLACQTDTRLPPQLTGLVCRRSSSDAAYELAETVRAQRECRLRPHYSDPMPADASKRKQLEMKIAAAARLHSHRRDRDRDSGEC